MILSTYNNYLSQYKQTLTLALPIIMSQAGQVVVQLIDNIMVGQLGADQLAAASLGGAIFWNVMVLGMGVSFGLTPIVGQLFVKGGHRASAQFFQNSLLLNLMIGVILASLMYGLSFLFGNMGQAESVVELAIPYFKYLALSMIPLMMFNSFKQFLEGLGNTRVAMFITISANVINVGLNYVFIYGHYGMPQMGVAGAGLATLISRILMPIMFVVYFMSKDSFKRYFSFFNNAEFSIARISSLCKVGLPISGQMFMEVLAFSLSSVMMGWIGAVELAANQICLSAVNFSFMVVVGIASATTILISHEMGRGDKKAMKRVSNASYHITMAYMTLSALFFIIFRTSIAAVFTPDEAVIHVAAQILIMAAVFEISDGLQAVSLGMLRGIKDVRGPMVIAFISYIVINLPIGYLLAFPLGLGASGLWIGFICGLSVAAILLIFRFKRMLRNLHVAQES